ncbi:MAG: potassium/proton antiporter [Cellvibrio sp.]
MFLIDKLILLGAVLIGLGVLSSKISARLGLPLLVVFLLVGMLAGEAGVGGIVFDNTQIAHAIGSLALAIILFDGGLQTSFGSIRAVWKPASILATYGVAVTAAITGVAAAYILDVPLYYGLLIGAIVGSTDAAAVFSILRSSGIHIKPRLKSTLEVESATNDPMAIFLTVGLLEVMVNDLEPGTGLLMLLIQQMGIGSIVGLVMGWIALKSLNKIELSAPGLYPILVLSFGLLGFGIAANIGGSGFLAIFIVGVVVGNNHFDFKRTTLMFHDGLAWMSQITMFVVLGLLINPLTLLDVWWQGLLLAFVLIFIARPLAVVPVLRLFKFTNREITLISWVGLRGSVPIILAIYPLIYGLPNAPLIFSVVFFVVLISATIQGSTLPWVARRLELTEDAPASPAASLEITALNNVDAEIVEYALGNQCRAAGRRLSQSALPEGTVVAMITRGQSVIPPRGSTLLQEGDHLFIVTKPETRAFIDQVFSTTGLSDTFVDAKNLRLKGYTRVADVQHSYGIDLNSSQELSLDELIRTHLPNPPAVGDKVELGTIELEVAEMIGDRISTVQLNSIKANVENIE